MTPDVNEQPDGSVCKHGALARVCLSCELEATVADLERQLAERTRERDDARTYCAGLASYICEPIYDDVANRRGVQADAQAAAGGAAVERWANADKQRLRAESAEQQVRALREILLELVDERSSADHWTRRAEVYEKARAALAQQEGGE